MRELIRGLSHTTTSTLINTSIVQYCAVMKIHQKGMGRVGNF